MWIKYTTGRDRGRIEQAGDDHGAQLVDLGLAVEVPPVVRLHLLASLVGAGFAHHPGDRIERPRAEACRLIEAGFAIASPDSIPMPSPAEVEAKLAEKLGEQLPTETTDAPAPELETTTAPQAKRRRKAKA